MDEFPRLFYTKGIEVHKLQYKTTEVSFSEQEELTMSFERHLKTIEI